MSSHPSHPYDEKRRSGSGSRKTMGLCLSEIRFAGKSDGRHTEKRVLSQQFRELGRIALMSA